MKFAMSYSCGKDSTLALHKMIEAGHEPVCLIVMINKNAERSYFHGADAEMLKKYEDALEIPMVKCPSCGDDYQNAFEKGLEISKSMGAQAVAFGDIDLDEHREWNERRCKNAGLTSFFPLWHSGREDVVRRIIELGYTCVIKSVNNGILPESLLGRSICEDTVRIIKDSGADACGENGEYHTLAVNGPIFKHPLDFKTGGILRFDDYSVIEIS